MKKYFAPLIAIVAWQTSMAQVGISNVTMVPHSTAMLQVDAGSETEPRGLLIPQFSAAQEANVLNNSPADGLMYYSMAKKKFIFIDNASPFMINPWRVTKDSSRMTFNTGAGSRVGIGNSDPQSTLDVTGDLKVSGTITGNGTIPIGGIIMWSGSPGAVPTGWALCDGTNSTPDLRSRFIAAYDGRTTGQPAEWIAAYNTVGSTGGTHLHNHTATAANESAHVHGLPTFTGMIVANTSGNPDHQPYSVEDDNADWSGDWRLTVNSLTTVDDEGQHKHSLAGDTGAGTAHTHTVAVAQTDLRPPFFVLAFIMRTQ